MQPLRIVLVGAGSRDFGAATVRDVLLSDTLAQRPLILTLMDIAADRLPEIESYARHVVQSLRREAIVHATTRLEEALEGADFVVTAVEIRRLLHWTQDYHIPRKYGFRQIFGENGGPGSLFHGLRSLNAVVPVARQMERQCPNAVLLNYTNPLHKVCEGVSRLTKIRFAGLCHGVWMGMEQIASMLDREVEELEMSACGINHFTWFQTIRDRRTGEDLYPRLRAAEREGDWLHDWHEIGMSRILLRRFGLYPSPGTNHFGEYIGWADEFYAGNLHWFYDPTEGHPWETGEIPEFVYSLSGDKTGRPWKRPPHAPGRLEDHPLEPSGELAAPIMEALAFGEPRSLDAINIPNRGYIPNLPDGAVVEVPATADAHGWHPSVMEPLPEPIAAMIRTQLSIHQLLVEAYAEQSKAKLLQAVLLEPTVHSYRAAVAMVDEMLTLQKEVLPPLY